MSSADAPGTVGACTALIDRESTLQRHEIGQIRTRWGKSSCEGPCLHGSAPARRALSSLRHARLWDTVPVRRGPQ